jgi:hypothetical protein
LTGPQRTTQFLASDSNDFEAFDPLNFSLVNVNLMSHHQRVEIRGEIFHGKAKPKKVHPQYRSM